MGADRRVRFDHKTRRTEETDGIKSCSFSIVSAVGWRWDLHQTRGVRRRQSIAFARDKRPTSAKSAEVTGTEIAIERTACASPTPSEAAFPTERTAVSIVDRSSISFLSFSDARRLPR
jgi:hypothetical protein